MKKSDKKKVPCKVCGRLFHPRGIGPHEAKAHPSGKEEEEKVLPNGQFSVEFLLATLSNINIETLEATIADTVMGGEARKAMVLAHLRKAYLLMGEGTNGGD